MLETLCAILLNKKIIKDNEYYKIMNQKEKQEYSKWAGVGLIFGVAIGSSLDFISGEFTGITASIGAGLGIVFGSMIGYYKIKSKK